jgi:predicted nucleic acid-binding protein
MSLVVDCSVAACWAIPDEMSALADLALTRAAEVGTIVPGIFWYELRNVMIVNERRGRLNLDETERGLAAVGNLGPVVDIEYSPAQLMALARHHRLSAYDASYLELALRTGSEFATLDRRLAASGAAEGETVLAAG